MAANCGKNAAERDKSPSARRYGTGRNTAETEHHCAYSAGQRRALNDWQTQSMRMTALVSMGTPGLVLVNIREKGKSQRDRPSLVDAWRLEEPLSESYSDEMDVESTVCHR